MHSLKTTLSKEYYDTEDLLLADNYRDTEKSRVPLLVWPREIPILGDGPADVVKFSTDWLNWLKTSSNVPKLYVQAVPGASHSMLKDVVPQISIYPGGDSHQRPSFCAGRFASGDRSGYPQVPD
jgi:hypothetical protein